MPKVKGNYSEAMLQKALEAIKRGDMSKKGAAKHFSIPRTTLLFRLSNKFTKVRPGPPTVLTSEEENVIEDWIITSQRKGFPKRKEDVLHAVKEFLDMEQRDHPFGSDNIPGDGWFRLFLKRHPNICLRTPDPVSSASSTVGASDIRAWFMSIERYLKENNLFEILSDPARIFNGDETNFLLCPKTKSVLAAKGAKNIYEVDRGLAKANLTVMFTFSASGTMVPPMVIYPYKRIHDDIRKSLPNDWGLGISDNGWMTKEVFYEYMSKVFHPYLVSLGTIFPVILFVDGHTTHQTLQLSKLCVQLGIILIALYPNATRIMQPADVSAFKPLKTGWNKKVGEWRRQNPGEFLTKSKFAPILNTVIQSCIGPETLRNGFRASGLFPWDQNAIDFSKCLGKSSDQPRLATDALKVPDKQLSYERFIQLVGDHKTTQFKNAFNGVCSTALWSDDLMLLYKMFLEFEPKENNEKPIVSTENVLLIETTQFDNTIGSYVDVSLVNPSDGFLYVNEEIEVEEIAESMLNTDFKTPAKVPQVIDDYLDWPITPERQGTKPIKPKKPFVITDPLWIKTEENKKKLKEQQIKDKQERKNKRLENIKKKILNKNERAKSKISKAKSTPKIRQQEPSDLDSLPTSLASTSTNISILMPIENGLSTELDKSRFDSSNNLARSAGILECAPSPQPHIIYIPSDPINVLQITNFCDKTINEPGKSSQTEPTKPLLNDENLEDIGENRIAVGSMCYKCTFSIKSKLGIRCNQCTREFHIACIKIMDMEYIPIFVCNNCKGLGCPK